MHIFFHSAIQISIEKKILLTVQSKRQMEALNEKVLLKQTPF